jgi:hypothetical protein
MLASLVLGQKSLKNIGLKGAKLLPWQRHQTFGLPGHPQVLGHPRMQKIRVIKFSTLWEKEVILVTVKMTKFKIIMVLVKISLSCNEKCIDSVPESGNLMTDESSVITLEGQNAQL